MPLSEQSELGDDLKFTELVGAILASARRSASCSGSSCQQTAGQSFPPDRSSCKTMIEPARGRSDAFTFASVGPKIRGVR